MHANGSRKDPIWTANAREGPRIEALNRSVFGTAVQSSFIRLYSRPFAVQSAVRFASIRGCPFSPAHGLVKEAGDSVIVLFAFSELGCCQGGTIAALGRRSQQ